jgi:signal transduction histidine kinase
MMLRTLRNRLILSHLLPLLIVIPLAGIAFVYLFETQIILPGLSDELVTEASLIAELAGDRPDLWQNPEDLNDLASRLTPQNDARLQFLDARGRLLSSTDLADKDRLGTILSDVDITAVQNGNSTFYIDYSQSLHAEVIDVFTPVFAADNQVIGIVRMSFPYITIYDQLLQMRFIILGILAIALVTGVGLGSFLAVTISAPIQQVTGAIDELAHGNQLQKLEEHGPEEIRSLVSSTNSLYERLHNLEQARKQLLANLVHELGRPLGALRSAIQSLALGAGNDPQLLSDLTVSMDAETARLQYLLNNLAHMHDQVFGTLELDRQLISLGEWLYTVLRPWEEAAHKKNLQWILELPDDLPDFEADPHRLAQAIENLVSNAIKYTPKGGTITSSAGVSDGEFWVKVSDTGPGIAPEEQEKVFVPFYRGAQKQRIKQGMGLGLSIVHDVVLAHGGEISLESAVGVGSSFTIWIPIK